VTDEEVAAATLCHSSHDVPDRDRAEDVLAADRVLAENITAADVALALDRRGFGEVAERVVGMQRQRVSSDYLQTSAVIDAAGAVHSAVNDPNDYRGPGTGYRLEGDRWALLQALPHELDPAGVGLVDANNGPGLLRDLGASVRGGAADEVVVAVGPAFGRTLRETIGGIPHEEVLRQVCAGIEEEGVRYRVIRIGRTSDVAFIAHDGAQLAGSGVAIGLQSKGTAVIQRADLQPLDNLELFGMAPLLRPDSYRQIGRNAARYANGGRASPVPLVLDNFARAKLIVRTALLHRRETEAIEPGAPAVDVTLS
jgi:propanediol dehydratase large subunit